MNHTNKHWSTIAQYYQNVNKYKVLSRKAKGFDWEVDEAPTWEEVHHYQLTLVDNLECALAHLNNSKKIQFKRQNGDWSDELPTDEAAFDKFTYRLLPSKKKLWVGTNVGSDKPYVLVENIEDCTLYKLYKWTQVEVEV
ncbi:hypothetical protein N9R79_08800 [Vibrio sp.]|nr:hypothetical protein [Vibrio sp.]